MNLHVGVQRDLLKLSTLQEYSLSLQKVTCSQTCKIFNSLYGWLRNQGKEGKLYQKFMRRAPAHSMGLKCQHSKFKIPTKPRQDRKPEGSGEKLSNEVIHAKTVQETTQQKSCSLYSSEVQGSAPICPQRKRRRIKHAGNFCKFSSANSEILFKSIKS